METFTVIVGSAYRDSYEFNYIVDALDAQQACAIATRIAEAHREDCRTPLYCFKGVVEFCPTIFNEGSAMKDKAPEVIDLRMPVAPAPIVQLPNRVARLSASRVTIRRVQKALTAMGFIAKHEFMSEGASLDVDIPATMTNDKMVEIIRGIYQQMPGVIRELPISIHIPAQRFPDEF